MRKDTIKKLEKLKSIGESYIKHYDNMINNKKCSTVIAGYLIYYCLEDFGRVKQKTLSISHIDKKYDFDKLIKVFEDIPELKNVFNIINLKKNLFCEEYPNRGKTLIFVCF